MARRTTGRQTGRPPQVSGDLMEVQAIMLAAAERPHLDADLRFALRRHANRIRAINERLTEQACPLCGQHDRDDDEPNRCQNCGNRLAREAVA